VAESGGLLRDYAPFENPPNSEQIQVSQALPRSRELAPVGSGRLVSGSRRDTSRDSETGAKLLHAIRH